MQPTSLPFQPAPSDERSALALANCATICAGVLRGIVGTAVSNNINGSRMTQEAIAQVVVTRLTSNLVNRYKASQLIVKSV